MSIVEKIGLLPILAQIGLSEDQFRGILKGEVEKLSAQEVVLNETIQTHANKINELTALRSKANQANEQEKLEIENEKKKLFELRGAIEQERRISANEKQEVLILRQKLNDDKDQFRKDREYFTQTQEKLNKEVKAFSLEVKAHAEKASSVEKLSDDLYVSIEKVRGDKLKIDEETALINEIKAKTLSEKEELKKEWEKIAEERKQMNEKSDFVLGNVSKDKATLSRQKSEFQAEVASVKESLRQREFELAKKEKEIENIHIFERRKHEDAEIEAARKKVEDQKIIDKKKKVK